MNRRLYNRREKQINIKIKEFKHKYYTSSFLNEYNTYAELFNLQSEIKQLLYIQKELLTHHSYRGHTVYHKQYRRFKRLYDSWRQDTLFAFFSYICAVPPWLFMEYM